MGFLDPKPLTPGALDAASAALAANPASDLGTALSATIGDVAIPRWQASTAYVAGDKVVTPSGDVVSAKVDFTSGATFTPANWSYVRFSDYFANVRSYGAKGDGSTNDTAAIQAATDAMHATGGGVVFFPALEFIITQIVWKKGVYYLGSGVGNFGTVGTPKATRLRQPSGQNKSMFLYDDPIQGNGRTYAGPCGMSHMELVGSASSTIGFGVDLTTTDGRGCCVQDTFTMHNLLFRNFAEGGIRFPQGGFPLHVRDLNFLWNGGPGITYTRTATGSTQAIHFDNISGDGNVGGLFYIDDNSVTTSGQFLFTNIKSEKRVNAAYGNIGQQDNVIVLNNVKAPVVLINCNHYSSVEDGVVPGAIIKATGAVPTVIWTAAVVVTAGRTGTALILEDVVSGKSVPATDSTVIHGSYAPARETRHTTTGSSVDAFGLDGWAKPSVASNMVGAIGPTPSFFLFETDAATNAKLWSWTASGGNLSLRTHTDAGSSGITAIELVRSASNVPTIKFNNSALEAATLESTTNSGSLVLKSPNGTRHRVQVSDAGALVVTAL